MGQIKSNLALSAKSNNQPISLTFGLRLCDYFENMYRISGDITPGLHLPFFFEKVCIWSRAFLYLEEISLDSVFFVNVPKQNFCLRRTPKITSNLDACNADPL